MTRVTAAKGAALQLARSGQGHNVNVPWRKKNPTFSHRICAPSGAQHTKNGLLASKETDPVPVGPMLAAAVDPPSSTATAAELNTVGTQYRSAVASVTAGASAISAAVRERRPASNSPRACILQHVSRDAITSRTVIITAATRPLMTAISVSKGNAPEH